MKIVETKYLGAFALVTSLFLLWGLANNMTDTLLSAFKRIMNMSDAQTSFIQSAFYGAYFCMALPAAFFIRRYSYKGGIILGLCLYAAGGILFLPAAKAASYGFYLVAIYVMACGCSVLETTANPYIMSMGSPETATRRLNVAQAFNPIGSIAGILLSKYFILSDISLYSVSYTYLSLGLVLLVLMVVMAFVRMPAGGDSPAAAPGFGATLGRLWRNRCYRSGVAAQFFYVGAQIGVWSFTIRLVMQELCVLESAAATVYFVSVAGFCLSRFAYTGLMKLYAPSRLLVVGAALSVLCALGVAFTAGGGWLTVVCLVLVSVFMSLMFPTIYGLSLEHIEEEEHGGAPGDAKLGAAGLIMAILGGAVITPLQGAVSDAFGIHRSFLVPAVCFGVVLWFAAAAVRRQSAAR